MPAVGHRQCPWLAGPMTSCSSCCYGFFGAGFVELHHLTVLSSFNADLCGAYVQKRERGVVDATWKPGCPDGPVRIQRFDSKQGWNKSETVIKKIRIYANLIHSISCTFGSDGINSYVNHPLPHHDMHTTWGVRDPTLKQDIWVCQLEVRILSCPLCIWMILWNVDIDLMC